MLFYVDPNSNLHSEYPNLSFSSNMLASTVYFDRQCIGNRR